jgi:flagellar protein FlbD
MYQWPRGFERTMIKLTRISNARLILNSDLIEHIDETPDTVITLISGQKLMVMESAEEIVGKVIEFRRTVLPYVPLAAVTLRHKDEDDEVQEYRNGR